MTSQDKKIWLQRHIALNHVINQKLDQLQRIKALCEKITSIVSDMPKGQPQRRDVLYVRMCDLEREIYDDMIECVDMQKEITRTIKHLEDMKLQTLLMRRYVNNETFEQIAYMMHYSWRQIVRLHGEALNALVIPEDVIECHNSL